MKLSKQIAGLESFQDRMNQIRLQELTTCEKALKSAVSPYLHSTIDVDETFGQITIDVDENGEWYNLESLLPRFFDCDVSNDKSWTVYGIKR